MLLHVVHEASFAGLMHHTQGEMDRGCRQAQTLDKTPSQAYNLPIESEIGSDAPSLGAALPQTKVIASARRETLRGTRHFSA